MRFKGWVPTGKPYKLKLREYDTSVGRGLIATDDPAFETTEPEPIGDDCVIIKNRVASVCGSDRWMLGYGQDARRPAGLQFGHEMVSEVIEIGKDVEGFEIGERVMPFPRFVKDDKAFAGRPGGYSELVVVEHAKKGYNLYPVPDNVSDITASMLEPLMVSFRAAANADPAPGKKAMVMGAGPIGIGCAIGLRELGVEDILILGRSRPRNELARSIDKVKPFDVMSTLDEGWQDALFEYFGEMPTQLGRGLRADIIIDAAGNPRLFEEVWNMTGMFATWSVVAVHHAEDPRVNLNRLTWTGSKLVGSPGYINEDADRVIKAMASERYDMDKMISHTFPHAELEHAIEDSLDHVKYFKVAIDYSK